MSERQRPSAMDVLTGNAGNKNKREKPGEDKPKKPIGYLEEKQGSIRPENDAKDDTPIENDPFFKKLKRLGQENEWKKSLDEFNKPGKEIPDEEFFGTIKKISDNNDDS